MPVRRLYTRGDLPEDWGYNQYLGSPGEPPFTRGIHASGYRGKLFTMRQFSGFASPEETNERYKYLLQSGGSGPQAGARGARNGRASQEEEHMNPVLKVLLRAKKSPDVVLAVVMAA